MQRRGFLKMVGLLPLVPLAKLAPEEVPQAQSPPDLITLHEGGTLTNADVRAAGVHVTGEHVRIENVRFDPTSVTYPGTRR